MVYIPIEIVDNILRRLPEESQIRLKVVCKEWQSIMNNDPSFPKLDMLLFISDDQPPCAIPLCSISKTTTTSSSYTIRVKNINADFCNYQIYGCSQFHCCFLLLSNRRTGFGAIWRPFSEEWINLELDPRLCYGLGYDVKTNDFKVVGVGNTYNDAFIYSLESRVWHKIQDIPSVYYRTGVPVFANGALHWLDVAAVSDQDVVISLDLSSETFSTLSSPPGCRGNRHLYAFEGCLFLSCTVYGLEWDYSLWILQDCEQGNGKKYWNKLIGKNVILERWLRTAMGLYPIAYVKSKEQVVFRCAEKLMLLLFDLRSNKCLKTIDIKGISPLDIRVLPASHDWLSSNHENGLKLDIQTSLCLDSSFQIGQLH